MVQFFMFIPKGEVKEILQYCFKNQLLFGFSGKIRFQFGRGFVRPKSFLLGPFLSYAAELSASKQHFPPSSTKVHFQ
jgi:hypothetical protein